MYRIALVLSFLLVSTTAFADNFSGYYGGFSAGLALARDKGVEFDPAIDGYTQKTIPHGLLFGGILGYNMPAKGHLVWGIEGDIDIRAADNDDSFQYYAGAADTQYPVKTTVRGSYSIRPRLGYLLNDSMTMAFVTAGFESADIRRAFSDTSTPATQTETHFQKGWTAGIGIDHIISSKMALRAEARYADLGVQNVDAGTVFSAGTYERQRFHESSLRGAVLWHF